MAVTIMVLVGTVFGAVVNMAEMQVSAVALTWMVIAGLGTVVALVAMIFRQLSRMVVSNQQKTLPTQITPVTSELYQARPDMLPESVPSVTEHTTRAFDPRYKQPVERQR